MMIWPYVLTESASPRVPSADGASLPAGIQLHSCCEDILSAFL